jgi:hypothetical protein
VNVKAIVITLFLVMIGTFTSPAFAQQFKEPNYVIRGGEVLGFEIDQETTSLIISLDARARGELTITLPRNLIDAKIGSQDSDFNIFINGIMKFDSFEETRTSSDRTVTIPFKRSNNEIKITGTQVFSQVTTVSTAQLQQQIEEKIEAELRSEIPEGKAKLLIFSDTKWSGALQASGFEYIEIDGQRDKSIIFGCETPPFSSGGIFRTKIQKITEDGYLKIVAIQNQKIMASESIQAQSGEIDISGNCVSSSKTGPGGGGCLIATATYGSELNEFYYTFSPGIADYERENPVFREAVKIGITPLIASLSVLNYVDLDSESDVLMYGISLILLNVGMYFVAPFVVFTKLKKTVF